MNKPNTLEMTDDEIMSTLKILFPSRTFIGILDNYIIEACGDNPANSLEELEKATDIDLRIFPRIKLINKTDIDDEIKAYYIKYDSKYNRLLMFKRELNMCELEVSRNVEILLDTKTGDMENIPCSLRTEGKIVNYISTENTLAYLTKSSTSEFFINIISNGHKTVESLGRYERMYEPFMILDNGKIKVYNEKYTEKHILDQSALAFTISAIALLTLLILKYITYSITVSNPRIVFIAIFLGLDIIATIGSMSDMIRSMAITTMSKNNNKKLLNLSYKLNLGIKNIKTIRIKK